MGAGMERRALYVAGAGAALGTLVDVREPVARGEHSYAVAERSGQLTVSVVPPDTAVPSLAITAGRQALDQAAALGLRDDPQRLVHCVVRDSGCDGWVAAPYVQLRLGIKHCFGSEVRTGCNGLSGVALTADAMRGTGETFALVTACDTWPPPIDRWRGPAGFAHADGGGALAVTTEPTPLRLTAIEVHSDPTMEALTRGGHPLHGPHPPLDLRQRASEFGMPEDEQWKRRDEGLTYVVGRVLSAAATTPGEVGHVVVPHLYRDHLEREILRPLKLGIGITTWEYGRRVGHLGAADLFASLGYLLRGDLAPARARLRQGDRVLMIGVGAGYSWGAALLDVVAPIDREWVS